jgi:hypothetical protein
MITETRYLTMVKAFSSTGKKFRKKTREAREEDYSLT